MAFVWFTGQTSSTQKTVVDEACTLDQFNMTFYESIYNSMKSVDESVKSAIYQCRDVTEALDPNRAGVFYLALAIASSLMLGITLLYLWQYEWSNMMAQFNISLLGCLLCLVLFCILNTIIWSSVVIDAFTGEHRQLVMILQIGTQVAQSLWNVFCIMASYARSESLIEDIWPRWCKLIRIVFHVSPVFYLAPIVPIAIPMMDPWQKKVLEFNEIEIKDYIGRAMDQRRNLALSIYILQAISAVWFMVLDAFFLRCFYVYILKLYGDVVIPVTPKLLIITRFGCHITSILTIFMSVVAIVKAAFEADGRDIKSKQLCSMTYLILSFCVALSFMAMKWCIHLSNKNEIGSKSSKINSNLTSMKKSNATLNMRE
ncbi:hypothetical protein BDR26DRAFT_860493 [Obelidium mucronatum]|nr:hypothetical protein BDR26DRAFT_860493 [Obelidium mucronatum]